MDEAERIRREFAAGWAKIGAAWGVAPSTAAVQGYLLLHGGPLTEAELRDALGFSHRAALLALRECETWGLVEQVEPRRARQRGPAGRAWIPVQDHWEWFRRVAGARKERETDPVLPLLDSCLRQAQGIGDGALRERLSSLLAFTHQFDRGVAAVVAADPRAMAHLFGVLATSRHELSSGSCRCSPTSRSRSSRRRQLSWVGCRQPPCGASWRWPETPAWPRSSHGSASLERSTMGRGPGPEFGRCRSGIRRQSFLHPNVWECHLRPLTSGGPGACSPRGVVGSDPRRSRRQKELSPRGQADDPKPALACHARPLCRIVVVVEGRGCADKAALEGWYSGGRGSDPYYRLLPRTGPSRPRRRTATPRTSC